MVFRRVNNPQGVGQLRHEMDRLFEDFFGPTSALQRVVSPHRAYPALNVWEEGENVIVEAEVPGLKSEDLEVSVVGNELALKGRHAPAANEGVAFHRRERTAGEFSRTLKLPSVVDAEKVQANLQDGVLRLTLPKAEKARLRKIEVKSN